MGHPLKTYLDKRDESIASLAARSGVGRPDISRVLNGARARFSIAAATKLSAATGLSVGVLLGLEQPSAAGAKKVRRPAASLRRRSS